MPEVKKTAAPKTQTPTARPVANGGNTRPGPNAPAATPPVVAGSPTTIAATGTSGFGYLGWFTVGAEGCTVQFGIEQQRYLLAATSCQLQRDVLDAPGLLARTGTR